MKQVTRQDEVRRIIELYKSEVEIQRLLTGQFATLHSRAQVMLALTGIGITTTGFSGRSIAGTSATAQILVVAGVATILGAAICVVAGVLQLRWLTQIPGESLEERLTTTLEYRDQKLRYYRIGLVLLMIGLAIYVSAIAIMLTHPYANVPPPVYR